MYAAKTSIAHAKDMVTRPRLCHHLRDQGINLIGHLRLGTHAGQDLPGIPAKTPTMAEGQIRIFQAPGPLGFHGSQLHGIGTRLENRQDALARPQFATQPIDGRPDGGRMVGKVVVERDAARRTDDGAAHFHASLHVFKSAQGAGSSHR